MSESRESRPRHDRRDPDEIIPIPFRPRGTGSSSPQRARRRYLTLAVWSGALILSALAWFSFTAVPVRFDVEPEGAEVSLPRTFFKFWLGNRFLLRSTKHAVLIHRDGYVPLRTAIEVERMEGGQTQRFAFILTKLPGRLSVRTVPEQSARVRIDGQDVGETPLLSPELFPGPHNVEVLADRYLPFAKPVDVEGGGVEQPLEVRLTPAWASITVSTSPPGAKFYVDGEELGTTPGSFDLLDGERELEIILPGYNPWKFYLPVEANQPRVLPEVVLREADARVVLTSDPAGAQVSVGAAYHGVTPLTLSIPSGEVQELTLFKPGYDVAVRSMELEPGQEQNLAIKLKPRLGVIDLVTRPEGAALEIDGRPSGPATQRLTLVAVPHRLVIRKEGYAPKELQVTPRPGSPQRREVSLQTEAEYRASRRLPVIVSKRGQRLALLPAGRFVMGSSRREPGRRANEVKREVELTRPYYLGVQEITNREFREFLPSHRSGMAGGHSLDGDAQPVVSVSWEQAARFCNWLSAKESLPPAYVMRRGTLVLARPVPAGYRLPTEAEWAWAARFAGGRADLRYPWGAQPFPPPNSGNFADTSAAGFLTPTLSGYTDGFPVAAPVGTGKPNALGLSNLGDNVAEWVNDVYTIHPRSAESTLVQDPLGLSSGPHHVVRGASWRSGDPAEIRLAFRDFEADGRDDVGFRIARYAD